MTDFKIISDGQSRMVTASGQLTIEHAAEMRDALLEALSTDGDMRIDMSGVEEADLTCVQLICSACKSARATGKNIYVKNPSRAVSARFGSGGFGDMQCEVSDRCPVAGGGND